MAEDEIQWPAGFGMDDLVSYGSTGLVVLDSTSDTVIKKPLDPEFASSVDIERRIYERLTEKGGHKGILCFRGVFEDGIRLEYAAELDLKSFADIERKLELRSSWILQIAEALQFIHRNGIIHGDLTSSNIFLDSNLVPKVADFAGSSLDHSPLLVESPASYCYPGSPLSVQGDIFAFGSLVYEIMTGRHPHEGKEGDEIRALFLRNIFPDTTQLGPLGHIVEKCWRRQYSCCDGLLKDLTT
jgi:serine/threonine protein kinase